MSHDSSNSKQIDLMRQEENRAVTMAERAAMVRTEPTNMLQAVMQAVKDPAMDPARLREFLEIGERLEARQAKQDFDRAMKEVQAELPEIDKRGLIIYKAGTKGTKFAKWDDVHRACTPVLNRHGLTCSFTSELEGSNALRVTIRVKGWGHEETGSLVVPWLDSGGSKSPAQQAASSFTLAQRHAFVKFFNVLSAEQDDDGSGKGVPEPITDEQRMRIDDILTACEEKQVGTRVRFMKWIKAEMQVDSIGELFQGDQLKSVMGQLSTKLKDLGIA